MNLTFNAKLPSFQISTINLVSAVLFIPIRMMAKAMKIRTKLK